MIRKRTSSAVLDFNAALFATEVEDELPYRGQLDIDLFEHQPCQRPQVVGSALDSGQRFIRVKRLRHARRIGCFARRRGGGEVCRTAHQRIDRIEQRSAPDRLGKVISHALIQLQRLVMSLRHGASTRDRGAMCFNRHQDYPLQPGPVFTVDMV